MKIRAGCEISYEPPDSNYRFNPQPTPNRSIHSISRPVQTDVHYRDMRLCLDGKPDRVALITLKTGASRGGC